MSHAVDPDGYASLDAYFRTTYGQRSLGVTVRELGKRAMTASRIPVERKAARAILDTLRPLRLHLGCADTYLEGWCNVDYARPGRLLDLRWDLRRRLPFPDGSAKEIFSEHVFEHIPYPGVMDVLRECHRLLRPGGVCRIGVPDLERYARSYLGDDPLIDEVRPHSPTRALAVAELFFLHGHRSSYDATTLCTMTKAAGFHLVETSRSGEGRIVPCPDSPRRKAETLYVDAVKSAHEESLHLSPSTE